MNYNLLFPKLLDFETLWFGEFQLEMELEGIINLTGFDISFKIFWFVTS